MPTFIKTGFWERQKTGYDEWLNLEDLINLLIQQSGGGGGIIEHNNTLNIQGGAPGDYLHVTSFEKADWNAKEPEFSAGTITQYFRGDKTFQDLNTSIVPEGSNLYYTEARVIANGEVAANIAARHNALTLGVNQNGLSLLNQVLSLGTASSSTTGALSAADWVAFNNKQSTLVSGVDIKTILGTSILGPGNYNIDHNTTTNIQGGNVGDYQHVTSAQIAAWNAAITTTVFKTVNTSSIFSNLPLAGFNVTAVINSFFVGVNAGNNATNASNSNFIGFNAGSGATGSPNSTYIGQEAGNGATGSAVSNFLGQSSGLNAINASNSNFLGRNSGNGASEASNSNFLGASAGLGATNASNSNFLGAGAGSNATGAFLSNFLGQNAGLGAVSTTNSNFLGPSAGQGASGSSFSNFFGKNTGSGAVNVTYSNLFGFQVGLPFIGNNIGSNNIIIGTNISLPNAATNRINIGGVIFGFNTYATTTGNPSITNSLNGRVAINKATDNNVDTLQIGGTLNIGSVPAGTSVNNLGIDATGKVVIGTTGGGGSVEHNDTLNIQGGLPGDYQHVTTAEKIEWNTPSNWTTLSGPGEILNKPFVIPAYLNETLSNLTVGTETFSNLNTGQYNIAFGIGCLQAITTGGENVAIGPYPLYNNTTGIGNSAFGASSLFNNTIGNYNLAIGSYALYKNISGNQNVGIGISALQENTIGNFNTSIGNSSLRNNVSGIGNVAIGAGAGENTKGNYNIGLGYGALNGVAEGTGTRNIAIGFQAGRDLSTGSNNILIENITNASITSGSNNIILDPRQKTGITTGSNNTIIGGYDGAFPAATANTVAIGDGAGSTRFLSVTSGVCTVPTQTPALITGNVDGFAILTKGYIPTLFTSPALTGTPTAPTATAGTNTTQVATTAFVANADANNVKLTGAQTITGSKTFSTLTQTIFNGNVSTPSILLNYSGGGLGFQIENTGIGIGLGVFNRNNASTSVGLYLNNETSSLGNFITAKTNNVTNRFTVDYLGNVTATSHVTTGGTTAQFVDGTGALQAKSQFQTAITGTANYLTKYGSGGVVQSQIFDNGTSVWIGNTAFGSAKLNLSSTGAARLIEIIREDAPITAGITGGPGFTLSTVPFANGTGGVFGNNILGYMKSPLESIGIRSATVPLSDTGTEPIIKLEANGSSTNGFSGITTVANRPILGVYNYGTRLMSIAANGDTTVNGNVFVNTTTSTSYDDIVEKNFTLGARGATGNVPMLATKTVNTLNTGFYQLALQSADVARTGEADMLFRTALNAGVNSISELTTTGNAFSFYNGVKELVTIKRNGNLLVNTGNALTFDIINQDSGSISMANAATGFEVPIIVGKSSNNTGLGLLAATPDVNPSADFSINVRRNNNTDFTTLTTSAFRLSRFGTTLIDVLRNGNTTVNGTISASPGTASNHVVVKSQLDAVGKRRKDVKYFAAGNIPQGTVLGGNFEEILYQSYKLIKVVVVFGEQSMNINKTIPFEIKTIDTDSAAPVATLQYTANCNAVVGAIQNKRYIFDINVTLPANKLLTVNTGAFTASTQILNNCLVTLVLEEV
jgi:hypothetical protein